MSEKKITKKDNFMELLTIDEVKKNSRLVEFIQHEIELLNRKSSEKKLTAKQVENEGYKALILKHLTDEKETVTDIMKAIPEFTDFSNQRVAALVKQLLDNGQIKKEIIKGRSYFSAKTE